MLPAAATLPSRSAPATMLLPLLPSGLTSPLCLAPPRSTWLWSQRNRIYRAAGPPSRLHSSGGASGKQPGIRGDQAETLAKMGELHAHRQLVREKVAGLELLQSIECLLTGETARRRQGWGVLNASS